MERVRASHVLPHDDVYYRLCWTMKLLPHLELDTLTVLGGYANSKVEGSAQVDYTTIDEIIKYGTGWRQLRYIIPDSSFLVFPRTECFGQTHRRKPQPGAWASLLSERDGLESGSSVTMYRSPAIGEHLQFPYNQQDTFQQSVAAQSLGDYGLEEDSFLAASNERVKAALVVVKRGRNTNVTEDIRQPPYDQSSDLRALLTNSTWPEVRKNFTEAAADEDQILEI